jgi:hypothetical protein
VNENNNEKAHDYITNKCSWPPASLIYLQKKKTTENNVGLKINKYIGRSLYDR